AASGGAGSAARRAACAIAAAGVLAALVPAAHAADSWSTPFPGVRRLSRTTARPWRINAVQVDLCAPGVSVRATRSSERRRTPSSFASLVGAELAVNGDFFSFETYAPRGLAVGQGETWGDNLSGYGHIALGAYRTLITPHLERLASPPSWMQQVVGGRPRIVQNGKVVSSSSSLCTVRHPRTAAGLSRDRRTLILAVVDGRSSSSIGMTCDELGALMVELGADIALNLDGGGSSAMWMKGIGVVNRPSDGAQRVVSNHLAVQADGSGLPAHCPYPRDEVLYLAAAAQ